MKLKLNISVILLVVIFTLGGILLIVKIVDIKEYNRVSSNESSDFLYPLSNALKQYRKTHGKLPTDDVDAMSLLKDYGFSASSLRSKYYKHGKLIWNNGRWRIVGSSSLTPICWFWNSKNWFYVAIIYENLKGEIGVKVILKRNLKEMEGK